MKVHPLPKQPNISLRYDIASALTQANANSLSSRRRKNLRRLPHIFAKVLELPFSSDADVTVEETPHSLRFVVTTDDLIDDVRAHTIEIYPGVTKIVIRGNGVVDATASFGELELELDIWRFRLPSSTLPELASAAYNDGQLVVTVPKGGDELYEDEDGEIGAQQFLLVQ